MQVSQALLPLNYTSLPVISEKVVAVYNLVTLDSIITEIYETKDFLDHAVPVTSLSCNSDSGEIPCENEKKKEKNQTCWTYYYLVLALRSTISK